MSKQLPKSTAEQRSLVVKFRYAVLFQGLLTLVVALVAFVPTLLALNERANRRREDAKTEVIDAGVNNTARLIAMELGRDFLPDLWQEADVLDSAVREGDEALIELANNRLDRLMHQLSERVAEKISYNSFLVDLIVVVPHLDPRPAAADRPDSRAADSVLVLPDINTSLPQVSMSDTIALRPLTQLTEILPADQQRYADSTLISYLLERAGGAGRKAFLMPIRREGFPFGYAAFVVDTELISEQFDTNWQLFWRGLQQSLGMLSILSMVALAGGALFISVLAARLIRPLEAMRGAVESVRADADGMLDTRDLRKASQRLAEIEADPLDEVGALRTTFLELSDHLGDVLAQKADALQRLKESTQQLQRADRLRLVGTLTYSLAHNLNNALAPIANVAHAALRRHPEDPKLAEMMAFVLSGITKSSDIVSRLRDLTRVSSGETVAVQVHSILDEALEAARRNLDEAHIEVVRDFQAVHDVQGNPVELWEVFTNLLVNAREALDRLPADRRRRITVRSFEDHGAVVVEVTDNGPGMTPEVVQKATEPWFSTKPAAESSGIGLWITQRIVAEHGGELKIESTVGEGSTVRVVLPKGATPAALPHVQESSP